MGSNMGSLEAVFEVAREQRCAVFTLSSIGAFGPDTLKTRAAGYDHATSHDVRDHKGRGRVAL